MQDLILLSPSNSVIAYPFSGITVRNQTGKCRTWKGDEFICVSAIDYRQSQLIKGVRVPEIYRFSAAQIAHIIATDTSDNRWLLEGFESEMIEWMARTHIREAPHQGQRQTSFKESSQSQISRIDRQDWVLGLNAEVQQHAAS